MPDSMDSKRLLDQAHAKRDDLAVHHHETEADVERTLAVFKEALTA